LSGKVGEVNVSIGIRNSGTEAKTSVTTRTSDSGLELSQLTNKIADFLRLNLIH